LSPSIIGTIFHVNSRAHRRGSRLYKHTAYLPAILWAVVVLGIGSLHHIPLPPTHLPIDKVGHFGMYGLLGALTAYGRARNTRSSPSSRNGIARNVMLPIVLACSIGAIDEIHQRYVPNRSSDILDFAADVAGISTGFWLVTRRTATQNMTHNIGTE
jgi:VanZ family protein